jgi:hypothetical protein
MAAHFFYRCALLATAERITRSQNPMLERIIRRVKSLKNTSKSSINL